MTIFNKITKKENSLRTAIKNGLYSNPSNFTFDKVINKKTSRFITHLNANKLIDSGKASLSDFLIPSNFITYNRIFINNKANQTIINNMKKNKFITYTVTASDAVDGNGFFSIYNAVQKKGISGNVKVTFKPNTPEEQIRFYKINGRLLSQIFKYDEGLQINLEDVEQNQKIIFEKINNDEITSTYATQEFLDGKNFHCLLDPIKSHFENLKLPKKKNYVEIIDNYKKIYSNGIPEKDIQHVCNVLHISIEIFDLFNRQTLNFSSTNSRHKFCFINQRYNHLELLNNYSLDTKTATLLNNDELKNKYDELLKNGENPLYQTDINNQITCIYSANKGVFSLNDPFKVARDKFNNSINLSFVKFTTEDKNIFNFLSKSSRTTTHQLFNPLYNFSEEEEQWKCIYNLNELKEYDLKKAYSQFQKNKYYIGFPSKLTNFQLINQLATKEFLEQNIGYFFINKINYSKLSENTFKFFKSLNISNGIYSTPELLLFQNHGLEFNIYYGLWSIVPYHFEFSPEMLESGYYKKWTGGLNMFSSKIKYYQKRLPSQEKFLGHILNSYCEEISIFSDIILFEREKKYKSTYGHIGGFLTAYTRSMMIEELLTHDFNDILALKLDSFICKNHVKPNNDLFIQKPVKVLNKNGIPFMNFSPIYTHSYEILTPPKSIFNNMYNSRVNLLKGQGGSGKTHFILTEQGFLDKFYSAVPWRLCVEKSKEYNIKSVSFASLIGKEFNDKKHLAYFQDPQINPTKHTPSNIIIDEMTMLTNDDIKKVSQLYPYSKIWFVGDVSYEGKAYQTTFGNNTFDLSNMNIINFDIDYRSKCDELKTLKLKLREFRELPISEPEQILEIYKFIKSKFAILNLVEVKDIYNVNDWILCSTKKSDNSRSKKINDVINGEKYRVISHSKKDIFNRLSGNNDYYLNGDWIINQKPNISESRYEKSNASTIHAIQGLTIEEDKKIFIDLNHLFDVNLIYTAISRARKINQLYFFR